MAYLLGFKPHPLKFSDFFLKMMEKSKNKKRKKNEKRWGGGLIQLNC